MNDERPAQHSIDVAIAALEKGRRAGWAKAYALEEELEQTRRELARVIDRAAESQRLSRYASAVLKVLAPSLVPWLNGGDPGVSTFGWGNGPALDSRDDGPPEYFEACRSDDVLELRKAGARDAASWLSLDAESREKQDWRAGQLLAWYDDQDAIVPQCGRCECASWSHLGPDGPCLKCTCDAYRTVVPGL